MMPATYHSVPESPVGYLGRLRVEQAERLQLVHGTPMIRPGVWQYPTVEAWRRSRERRRQDPSACSTPGCRFRRHTSGVLYEDLTDDGGIVEYLCCWRCRLFGGEAHGEMCEFLRLPHPGPVMWESFELPPHPGPPPPGPVLHEHGGIQLEETQLDMEQGSFNFEMLEDQAHVTLPATETQ